MGFQAAIIGKKSRLLGARTRVYRLRKRHKSAGLFCELLIVEDHRIVVMGCRALFAEHPRIEIVEAALLLRRGRSSRKANVNIAIIDTDLPDGAGLEFVRIMRSEHQSVRVIVLSPDSTPVQAMQAIESGAMAFVSKCYRSAGTSRCRSRSRKRRAVAAGRSGAADGADAQPRQVARIRNSAT